jgi:hypothetical protein
MTPPTRSSSALDALTKMQAQVEAMPPRCSRIYAVHSVPYGRVFRMWTTRGEMIAYINRGEMEDVPRVRPEQLGRSILSPALTGIPVVIE